MKSFCYESSQPLSDDCRGNIAQFIGDGNPSSGIRISRTKVTTTVYLLMAAGYHSSGFSLPSKTKTQNGDIGSRLAHDKPFASENHCAVAAVGWASGHIWFLTIAISQCMC
jgi:hypothetical protein